LALSLGSSITGTGNTAVGNSAMLHLTTGSDNVAVGFASLANLNTGSSNVVIGTNGLPALSTGGNNVAVGYNVGVGSFVSGDNNVAIGYQAMAGAQSGSHNIAIGENSLAALNGGMYNICLGASGAVNYTSTESNNIVLANSGVTGDNNIIRIGNQNNIAAYVTPNVLTQRAAIGFSGSAPASAGQILSPNGGILVVIANTSTVNITMPTGSDISNVLGNTVQTGFAFEFSVLNLNGANGFTLSSNTDVIIADTTGTPTIDKHTVFVCLNTGSNAWTVF